MRKPMKARSSAVRLALFALAAVVGACSGDVTMPTASTPAASVEAASRFVPTDAQKALIGVKDGNYSFTIDPRRDQVLTFGANRLELPANSICDLATSGYGVATWNLSCKPQTATVTITVAIKNASSDNPRIDFFPAMRFNPQTDVELFMYVPKVNKHDAKDWLMSYCPDKGKCYDESLTDRSLVTSVDKRSSMLFRRIKHFSGYLGAGRGEEEGSSEVMQ
jgi:hypothetical protein